MATDIKHTAASTTRTGSSSSSRIDAAHGKSDCADQAPMPWRLLIVAYAVTMSDSMLLFIIVPFVPEQCRLRWGVSEDMVGTASGAILGAVSLAACVSSSYVGHLSDIYGRKPVLCCGLVSGGLALVSYGLSTNVYWAFASLFVPTLFNANTTTVRAVCADLTAKGEQRAAAMGYMNACFSLSRFVSSSLGGLLAVRVAGVPLLDDNPYLAPCLVGTVSNAACLALVIFGLPETRRAPTPPSDEAYIDLDKQDQAGGRGGGDKAEPAQLLELRRPAFAERVAEVLRNPLALGLLACIAAGSFANNAIAVCLAMLFALDTAAMGAGFTTREAAAAYTWMGACGFLYQVLLNRRLLRALGVHRLCCSSHAGLVAVSVTIPAATALAALWATEAAHNALLWVMLLPLLAALAACLTCSSATLMAMQSNAADDHKQGAVMGLTSSASALMRSVGPLLVGSTFSLVSPLAAFGLLAVNYVACLALLLAPTVRLRHTRPAAD
jgi:MFS family permease